MTDSKQKKIKKVSDKNWKKQKADFTTDFFDDLLFKEEQLFFRNYNLELAQDLTQAYGQLVEYYDYHKDPIKHYFLEKIQFILSRPETIKIICEQDCINPDPIKECYQLPQERYHPVRQRKDSRDLQRCTEIKFQLEISRKQINQEDDMNKMLIDFSNIKNKLNSIYSQDMKKQSEQINKKLEQRLNSIKQTRKSKFMQQSLPQFDFQRLQSSIDNLREVNKTNLLI